MTLRNQLWIAAFAAALSMASFGACSEPAPLPAPPVSATPPTPPEPAAPGVSDVAAPTPPAPVAAEAPPAVPVTVVGPLELSPLKSNARVTRIGGSTCVASTIRFRVKNASSSDVRVALLMPGLSGTDDFGESLLGRIDLIKVSGVTALAAEPREGWANWISSNSAGFATLSPGQVVDAQMTPADVDDWRYLVCTKDPSSEHFRTYRPASYSLTGTIAVADLDGNSQVRSFSFSDVPLQVIAR